MNTDPTSALAELEREAFMLAKRAFQDGPSLAALCRALASCIETQAATTNALVSTGETFTPAHVACLCLIRSQADAALMVRWLRATAARLEKMPPTPEALKVIMEGDAASFAAWERVLFGEGGRR